MEKNEKKSSTYSLLKSLDETVQKNKKKEPPDSRSSNGLKRRRSRSPSPRRLPKRYATYRNSGKKNDHRKKPEVKNIEKEKVDYDIPDRSLGDLYCQACDSHMNSEQMWDAHIRGKRHLKQIKKGEPDQKYEDLDENPIILPEIKSVKEPIVGLQHCCEIRRLEGKPTYQCFLCSASISTSQLLIEHVIGLKHRMAYLKEYDLDNYNVILKTDLKKGMIEPVVEEYVQKLEEKWTSGKMHVKVEKPKPKETWLPVPNPVKKASASTFNSKKRSYEGDQFPNTKSSGNMSDRTRDYPRNSPIDDRFPESPRRDKWEHDLYDRHEATFTQRPVTPPHPFDTKFVRSNNLKSVDTNSPWNKSEQAPPPVDMHSILEKKRMLDMSQQRTAAASGSFDTLAALRGILEDLQPRVFLELVFYVMSRMNPTETELDLLHKIANCAFDFCMKKRLDKPPDYRNEFQDRAVGSNRSQGSIYTNASCEQNVPPAIQSLLDTFKNPKSDSQSAQPAYNYEPAFSTQSTPEVYSLWGNASNSKDSTAIPGLSLSLTQESPSFPPDERYASARGTWSSNQYNDAFNRY